MAHIQILPKLVTSTFTPLNDLLMELQKENPSNCADLVLKLRDATRRDVSLENNSAEYCRARRLASIIMDIIKSFSNDAYYGRFFSTRETDELIVGIIKRYVEILGYHFTYEKKEINITWETPIVNK